MISLLGNFGTLGKEMVLRLYLKSFKVIDGAPEATFSLTRAANTWAVTEKEGERNPGS